MANPTGKQGRSRTRKRRATWKTDMPRTSVCPQCHQPKLPHRVCEECGYYAGREVISTETAE